MVVRIHDLPLQFFRQQRTVHAAELWDVPCLLWFSDHGCETCRSFTDAGGPLARFFDCVEILPSKEVQVVLFEKEVKSHPVADGSRCVRFHPRWLAAVMPFDDRICREMMVQIGVTGLAPRVQHDPRACPARLIFVSSDGKPLDVLDTVFASLDPRALKPPAAVIAELFPAAEVPAAPCLEAATRSPVRVSAPTPAVARRRGEHVDHSKFSSRASSVRLPNLFPVSRPVSAQPSEGSATCAVVGLDEVVEGLVEACRGAGAAVDPGTVRVDDVVEQLSPPRSVTPLVAEAAPEILSWGRTLGDVAVSAAVGGWTGQQVAVRSQPLSLLGAVAAGLGADVRVVVDSEGKGVQQVQEVIDRAGATARERGTRRPPPAREGEHRRGRGGDTDLGCELQVDVSLEHATADGDGAGLGGNGSRLETLGAVPAAGADGVSQALLDEPPARQQQPEAGAVVQSLPATAAASPTEAHLTGASPLVDERNAVVPSDMGHGPQDPAVRKFSVSICSRIDQAISDIAVLPGIQVDAMQSWELQGWQVVCGGPVLVAVRQ
mmetsp:Transcript_92161/g.246358  ORF Transcript_92161/g.246358 Transcript_92161/m.246358 type:complete len:548 (+) Transcript_92161:35-1678(+)